MEDVHSLSAPAIQRVVCESEPEDSQEATTLGNAGCQPWFRPGDSQDPKGIRKHPEV